MTIPIVIKENKAKYNDMYRKGYDKDYPNLDVVRLERWYFKSKPGRVLILGFGVGVNLIHMIRRGYTVEGIEASEEAKRVVENKLDGEPELKKYAHLRVFNEEDTKLPYTDSSFDYVLCISVLSLLGSRSNVKNMLNEFHRVMKSNAKMIIDVNGPNSDFSNHATVIDEDVYEYRGLSGTEEPRVCYCPQNEEKFKTLLQELFKIDDMGHSSFQYVGNESFEYIACVRKKELAQATEKQGTLEDEEESTIQTPLDPLQ